MKIAIPFGYYVNGFGRMGKCVPSTILQEFNYKSCVIPKIYHPKDVEKLWKCLIKFRRNRYE